MGFSPGGYVPPNGPLIAWLLPGEGVVIPPRQPIRDGVDFKIVASAYTRKEYYECPYEPKCNFLPGLVEREPYGVGWIRKHRAEHNEWHVRYSDGTTTVFQF